MKETRRDKNGERELANKFTFKFISARKLLKFAIFWLGCRFKAKADTAQQEECNAMTSRLACLYRCTVICFAFDKATTTTTNGVIEFPAAADVAVAVEADAKSQQLQTATVDAASAFAAASAANQIGAPRAA